MWQLIIGYQEIILDLQKIVLGQLIDGSTWNLEVAIGVVVTFGVPYLT